jgi:hypothetical protein
MQFSFLDTVEATLLVLLIFALVCLFLFSIALVLYVVLNPVEKLLYKSTSRRDSIKKFLGRITGLGIVLIFLSLSSIMFIILTHTPEPKGASPYQLINHGSYYGLQWWQSYLIYISLFSGIILGFGGAIFQKSLERYINKKSDSK